MNHVCLALLCGVLVFGPAQALELAISPIADQVGRGDSGESPTPPHARPQPAAPATESGGRELPANPLWAIPLKQLSNTRERPIFSPSRRPPAVAVVGPPPAAAPVRVAPKPAGPQRPELSLIGTVIGQKESIAIFVDNTSKNPVRLRTGEVHQGWTLRSVQGREATLEKDSDSLNLSLPQPGVEQTASLPAAGTNRSGDRRH
jgi:general secretion pathway protein N